jgi:hypothetical protein
MEKKEEGREGREVGLGEGLAIYAREENAI